MYLYIPIYGPNEISEIHSALLSNIPYIIFFLSFILFFMQQAIKIPHTLHIGVIDKSWIPTQF